MSSNAENAETNAVPTVGNRANRTNVANVGTIPNTGVASGYMSLFNTAAFILSGLGLIAKRRKE